MGPTTVRVSVCRSFVRWTERVEDEGKTWTVSLVTPRDPRLGTDFGYACDCPEFRSAPGPCVHVLIAKGYHCGWHEAFDPERQTEPGTCPRCGDPTVEISYSPP